MYKGMEQHYYCREGTGPGAYLSIDKVPSVTSSVIMPFKFSVPQCDRGLLEIAKDDKPAPNKYQPDTRPTVHKYPTQKFSRASRDLCFSKYNSTHAELVKKGIY